MKTQLRRLPNWSILLAVLLSSAGCAHIPFWGYLPYQWGNVIAPLSMEQMKHFDARFKEVGEKPFILRDPEAAEVLSQLRGPVMDGFTNDLAENTVWLNMHERGFDFYRLRRASDGLRYSVVHFGAGGKFYGSGGGRDLPRWLQPQNWLSGGETTYEVEGRRGHVESAD